MKKRYIVVLGIFVLILILIFWYFSHNKANQINQKKNQEFNDQNFILNPFGESTQNDKDKEKKKEEEKENNEFQNFVKHKTPQLRELAKFPVAGLYLQYLTKEELHKINVDRDIFGTDKAWKFEDHISEIRFVDNQKGNIFKTYTNILETTRVSNTTIPKISKAVFLDKNKVILQYVDDNDKLKSYLMNLFEKTKEEIEKEKEKGTYQKGLMNFNGRYLPENILSLKVFKDKIFYLIKEGKKYNGYIEGIWGENKTKIFSSELWEWNIVWNNLNKIFFINKPSYVSFSVSFALNVQNGFFEKVLKGLKSGNGKPNHSFTKILYSYQDTNGDYRYFIYDLKTKNKVFVDGLIGVVDECVWNLEDTAVYCPVPSSQIFNGKNLDDWYKGYFNKYDDIVRINPDTGEFEIVFNADMFGKNFDIIDLGVDEFDDYLYFIDWNTMHPWLFRIDK